MRTKTILFTVLLLFISTATSGIVRAEADTAFITREDFFVMAARALVRENSPAAPLPFADAGMLQPENVQYIASLYRLGIVCGSEENGQLLLYPDKSITRQDAVTILGRLLELSTLPDGSFNPDALMTAEESETMIKTAFHNLLAAYPVYLTSEGITVATEAGIGIHGAADGERASFNLPSAVFGDGKNIYVADTYNNMIRVIKGNQTKCIAGDILAYDDYRFPKGYYKDGTLKSALFNRPFDGVVSRDSRLFIVDSGNHAIRYIDNGYVRTYSGGVPGYADGTADTARFNSPSAIAADNAGNLYIADTLNHCIRKIDLDGNVSTTAGVPGKQGFNNGAAQTALFNNPMGIAVSEDGSVIYVADTGNHLIRIIKDNQVRTLAGDIIYTDEDGDPLGGFADGMAEWAMFNLPIGLALTNEMLIVADSGNNRIRAVTNDGKVFTLAGSGEPGGINGAVNVAAFNLPTGVCISGNTLYIADTGNNLIRKITLVR